MQYPICTVYSVQCTIHECRKPGSRALPRRPKLQSEIHNIMYNYTITIRNFFFFFFSLIPQETTVVRSVICTGFNF
jgi:hypothetical protein